MFPIVFIFFNIFKIQSTIFPIKKLKKLSRIVQNIRNTIVTNKSSKCPRTVFFLIFGIDVQKQYNIIDNSNSFFLPKVYDGSNI